MRIFKKGDTLTCKKDWYNFFGESFYRNKTYEIVDPENDITHPASSAIIFKDGQIITCEEMEIYFCTLKEERQKKLNKINEIRLGSK